MTTTQNGTQHLVVVGAGLAGMATALAASARGHSVTIFEAGDKAGGAAAYSGGQVWIPANHVAQRAGLDDTIEEARAYIEGLATDYPELLDRDAMQRWLEESPRAAKYFEDLGAVTWSLIPNFADYFHPEAPGSKEDGRYLTAIFDGARLGEWRDRLHISPHFPIGQTYDELFGAGWRELEVHGGDAVSQGVSSFGVGGGGGGGNGNGGGKPSDLLSFGTGIAASFLARVLQDDNIEIRLEHRVTELLTERGRVTGVRVDGPDGTVEAQGPVAIATSGLDWDPELVEDYLGLKWGDSGSVAPSTLRGDGIKLTQAVGAGVVRFPARAVPLLSGYSVDGGQSYIYCLEHAYPHSFMVDETGRRFCDDSYYRDIVWKSLDPDDRHVPIYLIWDEQHHQRYGMGPTPPGGEYPSDLVKSAPTLRELGEKLGIDGEQLGRTAERFNGPAAKGEDPDFGRGSKQPVRRYSGDPAHPLHPNVGPVTDAPFFGMHIHLVGTGISSSGVHIDPDGRVLDEQGAPIAGLYAVGSSAAFTTSGSGYNSGYALSRAITLGLLVAERLESDARGEPVAVSPSGRTEEKA